jgi:hypothetical protein
MKKNSITNKITPCCGLPFKNMHWWVMNLKINSENNRSYIVSKIEQSGDLSIDAWKILINSITLEEDAVLTKNEFLEWFECGRSPSCGRLKILIESFQLGAENDDYLAYSGDNASDGSAIAFSAINDVKIINSGEISKIVGNFPNIGILSLFIARNRRFGVVFDIVKIFTVQVKSIGVNSFDTSKMGIKVEYGDYIGIHADSTSKPFYGIDSAFGVSWYQTSEPIIIGVERGFTLVENASFSLGFEVSRNTSNNNDNNVVVNKIRAVKNVENYNSIRNLITSITDANEFNVYEVFIPKGTWNEFDWHGKKYVKLFGDISGKTIINLDPLGSMAEKLVPDDFSFPTEIGKTISNVVQYARHIIFVQDDIHCENLTFMAKDSKYTIHIDNPNYKKAYFKNCHIIEDNCNFVVGMGINGGQEVEFEDCVLKSLNINKFGFFYHNWNNQSKGNKVTFNRCKFDNTRYGFIDELGSEQNDFINVLNCFSTMGVVGEWLNFMVDINSSGKTYWVNPQTGENESNPVNVPYCIVVNTAGTNVSNLTADDSANFNPDWAGIPHRDISVIKEMGVIKI